MTEIIASSVTQVSSATALGIRFVCMVLAIYGSILVIKEFKKGILQPIRARLVGTLVFIGLSNVPVQFVHWDKLFGKVVSENLAAFTAVTNSLATLLATFALISIIKFRTKR